MKKLWKLIQLLDLLFKRKIAVTNVIRGDFSIASSVILSRIKDICGELVVIVDVGANTGQFATSSRRFFPKAKIISFEPDPLTFEKLRKNVSIHDVEVINCALGGESGKLPFYRNKDSQTSSILPSATSENISKEDVIDVEVKRLDQLFSKQNFAQKTLLKLDVQGYEKAVLEGCGDLLEVIEFVLIEVSFKKFYEGEASFDELHGVLRKKGFKLLAPLNFLNQGIEILQSDFLYKKIAFPDQEVYL